MRIGIVFIIAGALLFLVTIPNSAWLTRGQRSESRTGTVVNNVLISGTKSSSSNYELAEINTLVLETFSGDIEVEISNTMSSLGQFEIKEKADDKRGVQQKTPILERQGNLLSLKATQPNACLNCSVSYHIKLGKAMRLELRTNNGSITVTGLSNSIKAQSVNGDITLVKTGKTVLDLESSGGDITLEQLALVANSQNKIRSTNGSIVFTQLENTSGLIIHGVSQNGDFISNRDDFQINSAESGQFQVTATGNNPAKLELFTNNGDITLE
jgi:CheY-specific phosphatase CheX